MIYRANTKQSEKPEKINVINRQNRFNVSRNHFASYYKPEKNQLDFFHRRNNRFGYMTKITAAFIEMPQLNNRENEERNVGALH